MTKEQKLHIQPATSKHSDGSAGVSQQNNMLTGGDASERSLDMGEYTISIGFLNHEGVIEKDWISEKDLEDMLRCVERILKVSNLNIGDEFIDNQDHATVKEKCWRVRNEDDKPNLQIWVE